MDEHEDYMPKRDKRRQGIAFRLHQISDLFEMERDFHYQEMLHTLQSTLYSLHMGDNAKFLEALADIEETRDEDMLSLYLWEKYQTESCENIYEREVEIANREYEEKTQLVKERLIARLEAQKKKLSEDKALLDVANDHSFFLSGHSVATRSKDSSSIGINSSRTRAAANGGPTVVDGNGGDRSGGERNGTPRSPGAIDRRSLRSRDFSMYEDMSGLSGGEGRAGSGHGSGRASRRYNNTSGGNTREAGGSGTSDLDFSERGDLEGMLFGKDRDGQSRQHTKSYHGVPAAKADEASDDINELRAAIKQQRDIDP